MRTKILLWSVVSVLTTGFTEEATKLPTITLSEGAKLTFLGTTCGRHQMAPGFENLGTANWIDTPTNDTTVVWIQMEHDPKKSWPTFALLVSDKANTACVTSESTTGSHVKDGVEVRGFQLKAFPRWEKETVLRIASPYGKDLGKEPWVISNPKVLSAENESPKLLPDTQSDGDVQVTLKKLITGAPLPPSYRHNNDVPQDDLQNKCVRIVFDLKQNGQSVTNWNPWYVIFSDAVGNHVHAVMRYQDNDFMRQHRNPSAPPLVYTADDEYKGYYLEHGLWPDEPAWHVRMVFTRTSGFTDDEILTLTNIVVKPGTQEDWDNEWSWEPGKLDPSIGDYTANGVRLKLFVPLLHPDKINGGQMISVIMRSDAAPEQNGMRMTLLNATDDQGQEMLTPFSPNAGYNCSIDFPRAKEIKSLNLRFALHKNRVVEFVTKPERFEKAVSNR